MGIVEKAWEVQHRIENRYNSIGRGQYSRILKMARKPTREEYVKIMGISAAGLLFIGFLGFAIYLIFKHAPDLF